jgi:hypothetical protein
MHVLDGHLQLVGVLGHDSPQDRLADALVFMAQFVADRPDCMPGDVGMGGKPGIGNAAHGLGNDED